MNDISFLPVSKGDGRKCGIIYGTIKGCIFGKERIKKIWERFGLVN